MSHKDAVIDALTIAGERCRGKGIGPTKEDWVMCRKQPEFRSMPGSNRVFMLIMGYRYSGRDVKAAEWREMIVSLGLSYPGYGREQSLNVDFSEWPASISKSVRQIEAGERKFFSMNRDHQRAIVAHVLESVANAITDNTVMSRNLFEKITPKWTPKTTSILRMFDSGSWANLMAHYGMRGGVANFTRTVEPPRPKECDCGTGRIATHRQIFSQLTSSGTEVKNSLMLCDECNREFLEIEGLT